MYATARTVSKMTGLQEQGLKTLQLDVNDAARIEVSAASLVFRVGVNELEELEGQVQQRSAKIMNSVIIALQILTMEKGCKDLAP